MGHSNQQLIEAQVRQPERGRRHVSYCVGLGEQPCSLARVRGSPASCRATTLHAKAERNLSSACFVKFASKSTASHYFAVLLRCSLAAGLKIVGQATRGIQRAVHGAKQRQIAQQGTTVDVALRKKCCCSSPWFSIDVGTSIPNPPGD